jgi:hypothetical protein
MKKMSIAAIRSDRFPPREQKDLTAAQIAMVGEIAGRRGKMPAPETVFLITAKNFRCAYQWEAHKGKALSTTLPPTSMRFSCRYHVKFHF